MLHRGETAAMKSLSKPVSYLTVLMLSHARASARRHRRTSIFTNEAGMLFDIRHFHFWNLAKAGIFMKTEGLSRESRNVDENKGLSVLKPRRQSAATAVIGPAVWRAGINPGQHRPWDSKIFNIENEGESHDIIENKGRNFLSHDVYDK